MAHDHFFKDPDALLDYGIDWSNWLADGDVISSSSWAVSPSDDLKTVEGSSSYDDTSTTVQVQDGLLGTVYVLTNSIVTANGLKDDRSIYIHVVAR